jgi:hypothetical protein
MLTAGGVHMITFKNKQNGFLKRGFSWKNGAIVLLMLNGAALSAQGSPDSCNKNTWQKSEAKHIGCKLNSIRAIGTEYITRASCGTVQYQTRDSNGNILSLGDFYVGGDGTFQIMPNGNSTHFQKGGGIVYPSGSYLQSCQPYSTVESAYTNNMYSPVLPWTTVKSTTPSVFCAVTATCPYSVQHMRFLVVRKNIAQKTSTLYYKAGKVQICVQGSTGKLMNCLAQ